MTWEIKGKTLEYFDDSHTYLYDGIILPSITQLLKKQNPDKYKDVPSFIMNRAAAAGTAVHSAIEKFEKEGIVSDLPEFYGYLYLKDRDNFTVKESEKPIVLFRGKKAVAAGRFDMLTNEGGKIGLEDIKRTSKLDIESVTLQLNLYRIGLRQSYGINAEYLKVIHLRNGERQRLPLEINELATKKLIKELCK